MLNLFAPMREFAESIACMALLALAYGMLRRRIGARIGADLLLGGVFGSAAVFSMFDPLLIAPGVIVDMRAVPMALAGAFLRTPGALVALAVAIAARSMIGGMGVVAGITGLSIALTGGLFWALWMRLHPAIQRARLLPLFALGLCGAAAVGSFALLPSEIMVYMFTTIAPALVPMSILGTMLCALLIMREGHFMSTEAVLHKNSTTDVLTGLMNRRGFEQAIAAQQWDRGEGVGHLLIDIDHFKSINDRFGHAAGDQVLRQIAIRLRGVLRHNDLVARIGGEEFVVCLRTPSPKGVKLLAETLRRHMAMTPFGTGREDEVISVSVSVGGHWVQAFDNLDHALAAADTALYAAKSGGRDQVCMAT